MKNRDFFSCSFERVSPNIRSLAKQFVLLVPVILFGCSSAELPKSIHAEELSETSLEITTRGEAVDETDVFIFNDDAFGRIDSYQRISGSQGAIASRKGKKIVVAILNPHCPKERWKGVTSIGGLLQMGMSLSDDDPDRPLMCARQRTIMGSGEVVQMEAKRLMSEIFLKFLSIDFTGTGFEGEPLEDVRAYLVNVNAECTMFESSGFSPLHIVNQGMEDEASMRDFLRKDMLVKDIGNVAGRKDVGTSLFCYQCDQGEETAGSPFTRLVIEGRIQGHLYYYPITINRHPFGEGGIGRNCRYEYEITICRAGTDDPDTPVNPMMVRLECRSIPWYLKENEVVVF